MGEPMYSLGVDVGGTFTDLFFVDNKTGEIRVDKDPSTPPGFIDGVMNVLKKTEIPAGEVGTFKHGSTIATNAIIEREGADTGLITTEGFRDVLEAARSTRPDLFDLRWTPRSPLVPRRNRLGVKERVDYKGNVIEELREDQVKDVMETFDKRGIESVSVCFINSFMNPVNERKAKSIIKKEYPDKFVSISSDILPEWKEFERTSTTVVNSYLGPTVGKYMERLLEDTREWGCERDPFIIHSGGGVMSLDATTNIPGRMCQSGPAGGVMAAKFMGDLTGFDNILSLDMGGTSADVGIVHNGEALISSLFRVEWNIPLMFPCVDIETIGAGGGSIAWIDDDGILKNGPKSAGADPGPVCYGTGGTEPTNTDAQLVLGRLNPDTFLGGEMPLDVEPARKTIKEDIADFYGWDLEEAATGILKVAYANMEEAVRLMTIERGYDPREFAMIGFGGAGPMVSVNLARRLHIPKVIIPPWPGVFSAFGCLQVDVRHDYVRPVLQRESQLDFGQLNQTFEELEEEAMKELEGEVGEKGEITLRREADVKYYPQSAYLTISAPSGRIDADDIDRIVERYNETHEREFGYRMPPEIAEVEIVNVRVVASAPAPKADIKKTLESGTPEKALKGTRNVFFEMNDAYEETYVYDRDRLPSTTLQTPAVVEQKDSTVVIPLGTEAEVDEYGNIIIDTVV